jgi:hypothetical protein
MLIVVILIDRPCASVFFKMICNDLIIACNMENVGCWIPGLFCAVMTAVYKIFSFLVP